MPKPAAPSSIQPAPRLTDQDIALFNEGTHCRLYDKMGAVSREGGTSFAVWAPDAEKVSVAGDFNGWDRGKHPLSPRGRSGIWEGFIPGVGKGQIYKYHIISRHNGIRVDKADPFALLCETPPKTASVVWDLDYAWKDAEWIRTRGRRNSLDAPMSIYEVHLGSWMRSPEDPGRCSRTGRSRRGWSTMPAAWVSRTSSSCRSWSTRSTAPGATS